MAKYTVKLLDRKEVANGTMAFYFEKPENFDFKAGQYMDWTLTNPKYTDSEGNTRTFSLVTAPYEEHIGFTTRMRDTAFKNSIKEMDLDKQIEASGAMGSFTLHNDSSKPAIFLIGGIGITPVRSIVSNSTYNKLPHQLFLFYSNRTKEDAAFLDELLELQKQNGNFKFIPTLTDLTSLPHEWNNEKGYITKEMINKYINDINNAVYYLSGPPEMVSGMKKILTELQINDDYIRSEEFSGYE